MIVPIVLASKSPRRRMLLEQVGISFVVQLPQTTEVTELDEGFPKTAMMNAKLKATSIKSPTYPWILGADTMVDFNGESLGKPNNADEAREMLNRLSGSSHLVHTGVVLLNWKLEELHTDWTTTKVGFRRISKMEIEDYIATGEPFDKAGAYGIQGRGALFIERIEGCFFNVMGLPLVRVWEMILKHCQTER